MPRKKINKPKRPNFLYITNSRLRIYVKTIKQTVNDDSYIYIHLYLAHRYLSPPNFGLHFKFLLIVNGIEQSWPNFLNPQPFQGLTMITLVRSNKNIRIHSARGRGGAPSSVTCRPRLAADVCASPATTNERTFVLGTTNCVFLFWKFADSDRSVIVLFWIYVTLFVLKLDFIRF